MKKTAGSDILHKPGDASGVMEATSRDMRRGEREEEERDGGEVWRRGLVDNVAFVSSLQC